MDVSVIIVNYKTKELCADCIESVFDKTEGLSYEVILVDNNSNDGSVSYLADKFGNSIRIVESETNLGFGRANNLGFNIAQGKYLFLLNSDTVLINNAIKLLYDYIDANKDIGIVGGNLFNKNREPMHSYMFEYPSLKNDFVPNIVTRLWRKLNYSRDNREFNAGDEPIEVGYVTGADMMVRRDAVEKCGGFDPEFFMYSEEVELTHRIRMQGYKVYSVPKARIIHLEGASSGAKTKLNKFKEKNWLNGKCLFYEKVYGIDSVEKFLKKHIFQCRRFILHDILLTQFNRVKRDNYKLKLAKLYYKNLKKGNVIYRG